MLQFRPYVLVILLLVCGIATHLHAQANVRSFFLYNVDTSAYPKVTANVYAIDPANNRYKNLSVTDFDLFENGQQKDATLVLNCDTSDTPLPVAVCLTLDQSFSMGTKTPAGDLYWDWVKFGAKTFIDTLKMIPPTCVAITSFGGSAFLRCPFQTTKPPLYAALDQIPIEGGTNYDEAFLNTSLPGGGNGAVAILRGAPITLRRFMIILTDGQPDRPPQKQRIIDSCVANGITVFAINIATPKIQSVNADLAEIAAKTNGKAFLARSKADMAAIYRLIALEIQRNVDCRLTWITTPGCSPQSRNRTLNAVIRKGTVTMNWSGSYVASYKSLANPRTSVSTLAFSDPGTGNKVRKTVTITAPEAINITINSLNSTPPGVFTVVSISKKLPCSLNAGESVDVVIEFTQTTTGTLHSGTLSIKGTPCDGSVALKVIIPILKLETPVGNEVLNGCDSIPIRWSGIAEDESISIMSSSDNGTHWNALENDAFGLQYMWSNKVEHDAGTQNPFAYKIKIQRSSCRWLNAIGGLADDSARSISYHPQQAMLSIGGSFSSLFAYASTNTVAKGGRDGYMATMTLNGLPKFAVLFGGTGDDDVVCTDVDSSLHYVVAGTTASRQVQLGDSLLNLGSLSTRCGFVSALDSNGKTLWVVAIGDTSGTNAGDLYLTSVHSRKDSSIVAQGYVRGNVAAIYMKSTQHPVKAYDSPNLANLYFPLTIEITKNGEVARFLPGFFEPSYQRAQKAVLVGTGIYQVGSFNGTMRCGQMSATSHGGSDGFVRAVVLNTGSDQSAKSFRIATPLVLFEVDQLDIPSVDVGTSRSFYVGQPMRSAGSVGVNLEAMFTCGIDSADFKVDPPIAPGVVSGFSSPQIWINDAPSPVNRRSRFAYLVAQPQCADPAFVRLLSYATFPSLSMTDVDFGRKRIGSVQTDTIFLSNNDVGAIPVTSIKENFNSSGQFKWSMNLPKDSMIQGKSRIPIVVAFRPTRIEKDSLEIRVDTTAAIPIPVHGIATGAGFLPRRNSQGYTFKVVPKGTLSAEVGSLIIRNIDTLSKLRVYSNRWKSNQSDDFSIVKAVGDSSIAPGDSIVLSVRYQPTTAGSHQAWYVFEHDAAPGPDPLPKAYDTVMVKADAVDLIADKRSIDFNPILLCDSSASSFMLTNTSSETSVNVTAFQQQGAVQDFRFEPQPPFSIGAQKSQVVRVYYKPTAATQSSSRLVIVHDAGESDTMDVRGTAVTASLSLTPTDTSLFVKINSRYNIRVEGNVQSTTPFALDSISLVLQTHPKQARFVSEAFNKSNNGWTWTYDSVGSVFTFHGTYSGAPKPNPVHFLDLPFDIYLSPIFENTMTVSALADYARACLILDSARIDFHEIASCSINISSVELSSPLAMSLHDKGSSQLGVDFNLSDNVPSRVEIYNVLGHRVYGFTEESTSKGQNSISLPLDRLSSGLYFVRLCADGQCEVRQFSVLR